MSRPIVFPGSMLVALLMASSVVAADRLEERWRRPLTPGYLPPVAVGGGVLLADGDGSVVALDASSGGEVGRQVGAGLVALYGGETAVGFADDGEVFAIGDDARMKRLDLCLPEATRGVGIRSDGIVVQPLADGSLLAIDLTAGAALWRTPFASTLRVAVESGFVFAILPGESLWILSATTGEPLTGLPVPGIESLPAMAGETLILGLSSRRLMGIEPLGGKRRFSTELGRGPTTDLLGVGPLAIVATQANQLIAMRSNGTPRWRAPIGGRVLTPLRRWRNLVIAVPYRRQELLGFDVATGALRMTARVGDGMEWLEGETLPLDDVLIVVVRRGTGRQLVAFGPAAKTVVAEPPRSLAR